MTREAALHYQVEIILIVEEAIKFHNIRMIQIHLNFNLPD